MWLVRGAWLSRYPRGYVSSLDFRPFSCGLESRLIIQDDVCLIYHSSVTIEKHWTTDIDFVHVARLWSLSLLLHCRRARERWLRLKRLPLIQRTTLTLATTPSRDSGSLSLHTGSRDPGKGRSVEYSQLCPSSLYCRLRRHYLRLFLAGTPTILCVLEWLDPVERYVGLYYRYFSRPVQCV